MKDIKKITPQVWLRRAILVVLDAALILFSFYFALLLRADGAVEAAWWPHNRALLYDNLPWIVALYLISFLVGGLYSTLWKYAGERDLIRLGGMIAVPTGIVYFVKVWEGTPAETEEMQPKWFLPSEFPYEDMWMADRVWLPMILKGERIRGTIYFDKDGETVYDLSLIHI